MSERLNKKSSLDREEAEFLEKIVNLSSKRVAEDISDSSEDGPGDKEDKKESLRLSAAYEFSALVAPFISKNEITAGSLYKLRGIGAEVADAADFFDVTIAEFEFILQREPALRQAWDSGFGVFKMVLRRNSLLLSKSNPSVLMFLYEQYLPKDMGEAKEKQRKAREKMLHSLASLESIILEKKLVEVSKGSDGTFVLPDVNAEKEPD